MRRNLPQIYREDPWIRAITDAMQGVMEAQEARARDVTVQESLDTVTWNLPVEERIAGLYPRSTATEEDRRAALKAKWRSGGKVTIDQVQAVADAWQDGAVAVSFPEGRIVVQFVGPYGVPKDMDTLKAAIRVVVPAHLPIDYFLRYLLIRDIHEVMPLETLERQQLQNFAFAEKEESL